MVALHRENFEKVPDTPSHQQVYDAVEDILADLRKKGTKICFAEMPVELELRDLPGPRYVRELVRNRFLSQGDLAIDLIYSSGDTYATVDGVHLDAESIAVLEVRFGEQLRNAGLAGWR